MSGLGKAENLLKSSGNADLITRNNKLSKSLTDNEIEIERLEDEASRALDGLTAKKNECTLFNQNIQALKGECASFTKRLNDSESDKKILKRKNKVQGDMLKKMKSRQKTHTPMETS